jgi:hypothetical protein
MLAVAPEISVSFRFVISARGTLFLKQLRKYKNCCPHHNFVIVSPQLRALGTLKDMQEVRL